MSNDFETRHKYFSRIKMSLIHSSIGSLELGKEFSLIQSRRVVLICSYLYAFKVVSYFDT